MSSLLHDAVGNVMRQHRVAIRRVLGTLSPAMLAKAFIEKEVMKSQDTIVVPGYLRIAVRTTHEFVDGGVVFTTKVNASADDGEETDD